jgi:hypothetical protein
MSNLDALIDQARAADILDVAHRLGAYLKRIRTSEWAGPCPACGGTDRFSVNTKRAMVQHAKGVEFRAAVEFIVGSGVTQHAPSPAAASPITPSQSDNGVRDLASARRIASEIRPLLGTDGERYLRKIRGIDTSANEDVLARADAIGWHDAVYYKDRGHALHGQRLGCIVGIMTDAGTGRPTGAISRTYLAADLTKVGKAKTLGIPAGVVRLSPDEDVLGGLFLAEGIETALAAMAIGLRPTWSTSGKTLTPRAAARGPRGKRKPDGAPQAGRPEFFVRTPLAISMTS